MTVCKLTSMHIKKFLRLFFIFGIVSLISYFVFKSNDSTFVYSQYGVKVPESYTIFGLDVSHHQGEIDFQKVIESGKDGDAISFVYIKSSEGENHKDRNYDINAEGFAAEKLNYGFYHYFQPDRSAIKQALFFTNIIDGYNFKLIPVIDVEVKGHARNESLIDSILMFQQIVEDRLLIRPMIYTYVSFFEDYLNVEELQNELFWLASYNGKNPYMGNKNVVMWQFTERAKVAGLTTYVDLNVAKDDFFNKVVLSRYKN